MIICGDTQLSFSEIETELANLPNFAAKFGKLGNLPILPDSVKIKNPLNISKFKF